MTELLNASSPISTSPFCPSRFLSCIDVLRKLQAADSPTRVCVITGCGPELIDEANRAGAEQTFIKPLDVGRLITLLNSEAQPAS